MPNLFLDVIVPLIAVMVFVPFTDGSVDTCWNVRKNQKFYGGLIQASWRINTMDLCRAYCAYQKKCYIMDYDKKNDTRPCYILDKVAFNRNLLTPERGRSSYTAHRPCIVKQIITGSNYRKYLNVIVEEMSTRTVYRNRGEPDDERMVKYFQEQPETSRADPELRIRDELNKAKDSLDYSYEND